MTVRTFTFNPLEENTYVIADESRQAAVIDPGCYTRAEQQELHQYIQAEQLTVTHLINTHAHIDHVLGNAFVKNQYKVPLYLHPKEEAVLAAAKIYAPMYGFPLYQESVADRWLTPGEDIQIGSLRLQILFLPGHSPGHVGLYHPAEKILISGDVLFHRSVGRTDLPGGNWDVLVHTIQSAVFALPDDVQVLPGHGPATTVGEEKKLNPFVGRAALA